MTTLTFTKPQFPKWRSYRLCLSSLATVAMILLSFLSYAADVRVYTYDSQGNPITGQFKVQKTPGSNPVMTFNSGDTASLDAGFDYKIWGVYEKTTTPELIHTVSAGGDSLAFHTTNVKFNFSGGYLNYRGSGDWNSFDKDTITGEWHDRELFPLDFYGDTMRIMVAYKWNDRREVIFDFDFQNQSSVEKTVSILRVWDSDGNPIAGATARGGYATPTLWFVPGSTNSDGLLLDLRDGKQTNLSYEARVNGTVAVEGPKDPTTDSYYLFQTSEVVLRLQSCDGNGIAGGRARFGNDSVYFTRWFPDNPGVLTDSTGMTVGQLFPGTYSFEMQYEGTSDRKFVVMIPAAGDTITWNTVSVNLTSSSSISYGGPGGVSKPFNQPSMELLPGTYKFKFNSNGEVKDLTLSGCNFTKSEVIVDVLDCDGNNQDSVDIKWYKYGDAGNKVNAGFTGNSTMSLLIDSGTTKIGVVADYLGQTNTLIQTLSVNNHFIFQMIDVNLALYNHDSTTALVPQDVQFFVYGQAGNKMPFPATLSKCLLPGNYGFVVTYNNTSAARNGIDVSTENPVIFQTGLVDDLDACTFSPTTYYQYGQAGNQHNFIDPMEFMPAKVIVLSSVNPSKTINVVSGAIHRLDTCANVAIMDSCVSDSSWMTSTVVTSSNHSGFWGGVSSLPDTSTFTDSAEIGFPKPWGGMGIAPGSLPIKSSNHIHYFMKKFGLTDTTGLDARFRMYMDDGVEIYINGVLISREENMDWHNFNGVPHDLQFYANNTYDNGYLGGDMFDYVAPINLDTILRKDLNTIIIVLRNPASSKNNGGFSFRMDISKNGQSVLVKKKQEAGLQAEDGVLAIYPNPSHGSLFIDLDELNLTPGTDAEINIYNMNGQVVLSKVLTETYGELELDLNHLNTGFYFIRYINGEDVRHAKLIKR